MGLNAFFKASTGYYHLSFVLSFYGLILFNQALRGIDQLRLLVDLD